MRIGWGSLAGAVAEACFVAGDVLLLGHRVDTEAHPVLRREGVDEKLGAMLSASPRQLRTGALLGVLSAPLLHLGAYDQYRAVRGGGAKGADLAVVLAMGAHSLAPFIHGSFAPWGEALRAADEAERAGAGEGEVVARLARVRRIERLLEPTYAAYFGAIALSSIILTDRIARGRTDYPRWSAVVIPPAWPMVVATALTASHVLPTDRVRYGLQGAGFSLGGLVSFAASALLRRR